jgi:heme exporter protein B
LTALLASLRREIKLRVQSPAQLLQPPAFAVLIALLVGFSVGASPNALRFIAPAALFIAMLLAIFLALEQLFANDVQDGTLDALLCAPDTLAPVLYGKAIAFWLCNIATLIFALPVLMVLLKLPVELAPVIVVSLLLASISLSFLGLAGSALTTRLAAEGAGTGAMLLLLLVLPQAVPVLIFSLGAVNAVALGESPASALYFLSAIALIYLTLAPLAAKLALRG